MTIPAWVTETIRYESDAKDEEILDCQVLKESAFRKIAVVATERHHFVVHQGLIGGEAFHVNLFEQPISRPLADLPEVQTGREPEEPTTLTLRRSMGEFRGDVHPVIEVEGIGETYADALASLGIQDTRELWAADPEPVAETLNVSPKVVAGWQTMAELIGLKGIGPQYAELLARSGIAGVVELADADPLELLETVRAKQQGLDVSIQGNIIGPGRVTSWINAARDKRGMPSAAKPDLPTRGKPTVDLTILKGVGAKRAEQLTTLGVTSFEALAEARTSDLAEALDVSEETVTAWRRQVDLTGINGIGPKRSKMLRAHGVSTVRDLVLAEPTELARTLDVTRDAVGGWQKAALDTVPELTDLTEVKGIGAARALELLQNGITTRTELADADAEAIAEALDVSPKQVRNWQANA